jgi:spoIIIJ-associated protein
MIKIVAPTLEEAYKKASVALDCSIVDIDIEILQAPSRGIFGLFSREAIINASHKSKKESSDSEIAAMKHTPASKSIQPDDKLLHEIEQGMQQLLQNSCFKANVTSVTLDEKNGVLISIDGEDAALMIGKEGYRYKALSYMIHNWVKVKYHLTSTLEIAQFLETQKESIEKYLDTFSEKVDEAGRGQTKPLDGILVKLALESLRTRYVDKYVAIRTLKNGKKVIVVNEYTKK